MEKRKVVFNNEHESIYVSARVFSFVLDNTKKVNPEMDLSRFEDKEGKIDLNNAYKIKKVDLATMVDFFQTCLEHQFTFDDFYLVGYRIHQLHFSLVSLLFKLTINFTTPMKNEISFLKVSFDSKEHELSLVTEIVNILVLDAKIICTPILKIVHGFIDRLFKTYLNNKPEVILREDSLSFTYKQQFVSNFDIARYITNEQFFFSRIKNHINLTVEERAKEKVEFYLFRDISFSIEEIANRIELSVRALQRKLKEEDTSFRKIKEAVRRQLSEKFLQDESLTIHEISDLLAYSERGAFEKAFKKWFGENPNVFRKKFA